MADEQRRVAAVVVERAQLRANALGLVDCIGQSVANIAPTLTPALNIAVVAGLAGSGSWLGFLISTVAVLFVALNIATLSRRHTLSGSYFIYIGRTVGPLAGLIAGWVMIGAYLATTIAVSVAEVLFLDNFLASLGLKAYMPSPYVAVSGFIAIASFAAYRDVRLTARFGLVLEIGSVLILIAIAALVVLQRGTLVDPRQLDFTALGNGGIMSSLTFAVLTRRDAKSGTTYILRRIDCAAREFQYLGEGTTEQQAREGRAAEPRKNRLTEDSIPFYVAAYACAGWSHQ